MYGQVCSRLIEPPSSDAVERALKELVLLEALTLDRSGKESLTPLGVHLSTLPVDVRIGKLILFGAMFDVLDEALTIAATLSYRSPFLSPISKREEADQARNERLTKSIFSNSKSIFSNMERMRISKPRQYIVTNLTLVPLLVWIRRNGPLR